VTPSTLVFKDSGEGTSRHVVALLLIASFVLIIGGAVAFTNAVEWFGHKLNLGQGAVGSILAAVATALPESVIPVIALLKGSDSREVATGAIIGAPFLLSTLALMLVGIGIAGWAGRRDQDRAVDADNRTVRRDLLFFLGAFAAAFALGLGSPQPVQVACAVLFVAAYGVYLVRTVKKGGDADEEEELRPLYVDWTRDDPPNSFQLGLQLVLSIGAIIFGAHLFVEELVKVSESIGVPALALSLVLAPLATEMPEKMNSLIWVREGKDSLALGNITGAMTFQSTLPVALGLAFTPWRFDFLSGLAVALGIAGALLALFTLLRRQQIGVPSILAWGALYVTFVVAVLIVS
jgi:cation:H+ antiporter